jgi:hypothetical protein
MPVTLAENSAELDASLVALVATMRTAWGPASAISPAYSRSAVIVRSSAATERRPVRSTPSPSRTMRISLRMSVSGAGDAGAGSEPPGTRSGSSAFDLMSAISSLIEFVPQSIAATRVVTSSPRG